jgi:hypothetical protein
MAYIASIKFRRASITLKVVYISPKMAYIASTKFRRASIAPRVAYDNL